MLVVDAADILHCVGVGVPFKVYRHVRYILPSSPRIPHQDIRRKLNMNISILLWGTRVDAYSVIFQD